MGAILAAVAQRAAWPGTIYEVNEIVAAPRLLRQLGTATTSHNIHPPPPSLPFWVPCPPIACNVSARFANVIGANVAKGPFLFSDSFSALESYVRNVNKGRVLRWGVGWNTVGGAEASLSCQLLPLCPALSFSSVVSVLSIFDKGVDSG